MEFLRAPDNRSFGKTENTQTQENRIMRPFFGIFLITLSFLLGGCGFPGCFTGHLKRNNYLDNSVNGLQAKYVRRLLIANLSERHEKGNTAYYVISELEKYGANCNANMQKGVVNCSHYQYIECGSRPLFEKNVGRKSEFLMNIEIPLESDWFSDINVTVDEKKTIFRQQE